MRLLLPALLLLTAGSLVNTAHAQTGVGASLGFNVDFHYSMAAVQARLDARDLGARVPVVLNPSAEVYYDLGFDLYHVEVNLLYLLPRPYPELEPYAGAGVGVTRGESPFRDRVVDRSTESFNLLLGAQVDVWRRIIPFAQVRIALIRGNDHTSVSAGGLLRF